MAKFKVGDKITMSNRGKDYQRIVMASYEHKYVLRSITNNIDWIYEKQCIDNTHILMPNEIIVGNSYPPSKLNCIGSRVIGICKENNINYIVYVTHGTGEIRLDTEALFRKYYDV